VPVDREKVQQAAQKFIEKRRYDKAIAEYRRIVAEDPSDARTWLKIGDLQARDGAFGEAVATYDRVGRHYAQQGFALKAIAVFKQIREIIVRRVPDLESQYEHVLPTLADLYAQTDHLADARAALEEFAVIYLMRLERHAQAAEVLRKALSLGGQTWGVHLNLAECLSRVGNVVEAVDHFAEAARLLVERGQRDDALRVLDRLLHHRRDAEFARFAAELLLQGGTAAEAKRALHRLQVAYESNQKDVRTLELLARCFELMGDSKKAIQVYSELVRIAREQNASVVLRHAADRLTLIAPDDPLTLEVSRAAHGAPAAPPVRRTSSHFAAAPIATPAVAPVHAAPPPAPKPIATEVRAPSLVPAADDDIDLVEEDEVEAPVDLVRPRGDTPIPTNTGTLRGLPEAVGEALAQAESLRERGQLRAASTILQRAWQLAPRSLDVMEALCEVERAAGNAEGAVTVLLALARRQAELGDIDAAAYSLQDVLALERQHPEAIALLAQLGFEPVDEPFDDGAPGSPAPEPEIERATEARIVSSPFMPQPEEPRDEVVERSESRRHSLRPGPAADVDATLDDADVYLSLGLIGDARSLVEDMLVRVPHHPRLLDKLDEIAQRELSMSPEYGLPSAPSLEELAAESPVERHSADLLQAVPMIESVVDVDAVFEQFRESFAELHSRDDAIAQIEAARAYRAMGLLDDAANAIAEPLANDEVRWMALEELARIELERDHLAQALEAAEKSALVAPDDTTRSPARYLAAELAERLGDTATAVKYFEWLAARSYDDAQARASKLRSKFLSL
jgi:tetratricopeptide (TPR) repeat protein